MVSLSSVPRMVSVLAAVAELIPTSSTLVTLMSPTPELSIRPSVARAPWVNLAFTGTVTFSTSPEMGSPPSMLTVVPARFTRLTVSVPVRVWMFKEEKLLKDCKLYNGAPPTRSVTRTSSLPGVPARVKSASKRSRPLVPGLAGAVPRSVRLSVSPAAPDGLLPLTMMLVLRR